MFLLSVAGILAGCSPAVVMKSPAHPPVAVNQVKVYLSVPAHYKVIALLTRPPLGGYNSGEFNAKALLALKRKAASLGANGLLLTNVQPNMPSQSCGMHACRQDVYPMWQAEAIRVLKRLSG